LMEALHEDPSEVYDKFGTAVFDPDLAKFGKEPLLVVEPAVVLAKPRHIEDLGEGKIREAREYVMGYAGWHMRPAIAIKKWLKTHEQTEIYLTVDGKRQSARDISVGIAGSDRAQVIVEVEGTQLEADEVFAVIEALHEELEEVFDNLGTPVFDPDLAKFGKAPLLRSEVRAASTISRNELKELQTIWSRTVTTSGAASASLATVRQFGVGTGRFTDETRSLAEQSGYVYDSPESIAERLNLPLLEVYGRLIRTLLEDSAEDQVKMMQLREIVKRYMGDSAKALEGHAEINYQYLELASVDELTEDTAYALAVLSLVRPQGDQIRVYVTGDDALVISERIADITRTYEATLAKMGAEGRANLEMIDVFGWDNAEIQQSMLTFATGKNAKLQAAILSAREEFLNGVQIVSNAHRMNRAQISRAQALLASPVLLAAAAIDEHTLDILQMRDELERLGLSSLLSARFSQMMAEVKALASSA